MRTGIAASKPLGLVEKPLPFGSLRDHEFSEKLITFATPDFKKFKSKIGRTQVAAYFAFHHFAEAPGMKTRDLMEEPP
jgi:hypothetical protein